MRSSVIMRLVQTFVCYCKRQYFRMRSRRPLAPALAVHTLFAFCSFCFTV